MKNLDENGNTLIVNEDDEVKFREIVFMTISDSEISRGEIACC